MTYAAYFTRIKNVRKHPNADKILLADCFGNQVVVGINSKEGDLGIYFESDGRLFEEFLVANKLVGEIDKETGERSGGFFDAKGRVRAQKFRGEKSDGFWCPLSYLNYIGVDTIEISQMEGVPFTEYKGHKICEKYVTERTQRASGGKKERKEAPVKFPTFHEHPDTEQLAYNIGELKAGMNLVVTEKVHGTSQRTAHTIQLHRSWLGQLINSLLRRKVVKEKQSWGYACGTRHVIINVDNLHGFYGTNEGFRKTAHERFVGRLQKGETVYYEIVGWQSVGKPLMPAGENKKVQDKAFAKRYGDKTTFHYGCPDGTTEVYVYRMSITNEDGFEVDYDWEFTKKRCEQIGVKVVPEISKLKYAGDGEALLKSITEYIERPSLLTDAHIMEGAVVRVDGSKWMALKHKSFQFKVLEGIIKDTGVEDMEEAS